MNILFINYFYETPTGNTIDFLVSVNRDKHSARKFLKKAISEPHNIQSRVIITDKYPATELTILEEKYYGELSCRVQHRMIQYLKD